jgi:hypothetical protein
MPRIRRNCEVPGCENKVTHGKCDFHIVAERRAEVEREVADQEAERIRLGLSITWGCLDPDCEICS